MILGIDTSCDETSAAVLDGKKVMSSIVLSQDIHKIWGGVVPILAKRAHKAYLPKVVESALREANATWNEIEAIAVTRGPGLAIALEVGIKYALELGKKHGIPVVPVNHIEGHIYSSDISYGDFQGIEWKFPALAVVLSGGHTEMHLMENHCSYKLIGRTRDDSIGELFDKIGREMGLGYPAGKKIDELGSEGERKYDLPVPMKNSWEFSFSGLKTASLLLLRKIGKSGREMKDFARSLEEAAFESVMIKIRKAVEKYQPEMIVAGGGVTANSLFRKSLKNLGVEYHVPGMKFTGDNGAMIARAGLERMHAGYKKEYDRLPRWRVEDA